MKQIRQFALMALVATGVASSLLADSSQAASRRFVAIGTGGPQGVYIAVGNAVCRMVNKSAAGKKNGLYCSAPSTGGSVYNVNAVRTHELNLGVVQSDVQQQAYAGTGKFEGNKFEKLRTLFSIHPEPFQLLVGKNSGINSWADLAGKRVNIGNAGSGQRGTFEALMLAHNVDGSFFGKVFELSSNEQSKALCNETIDAYGYTVGVPNAGVAYATNKCGARIITLQDKNVARLVADNPYYAYSTIPKGTYSTTKSDVKTFGVMATLVTSADSSEEQVYEVVKAVFDHLDQFRKQHPALAKLDPKKMISDGLASPLHPGALKYYKEKGWVE
ncbi:MAG: TAXI family TRAP transporter solute-binding subunit [Hyphomicrobiaceae bacterium]|nr:TAXI family TRAP transporter solute-binding subunit [Hyphomicrobiaceae bacterium]